MRRPFLLLVVLSFVTVAGCTVERTVALADGTQQTFKFKDNLPMSSETAAARVNMAGINFTRPVGADQLQWQWQCMLTPRVGPLRSVVVHDVTREMDLVIRDGSPKLTNGKWMGASSLRPFASTPWLNDDKDDLIVLRFDVTTDSGATHTIYQPTMMWKEISAIQAAMQ